MEHLAILGAVFGIFIPALLLPGPDFVAVVRASLVRGKRDGLLTAGGVTIGLGLYATLALLGLSALLAQSVWLTWLIRLLGGSYLVWLGLRLLFSRAAPVERTATTEAPAARGNAMRLGFLMTLANPKAIVLFASVFATAVDGTTPAWLKLSMIGLVMACTLTWYAIVATVITSPPVLRRFSRWRHGIERVAGACFVGFGGRIIADARQMP